MNSIRFNYADVTSIPFNRKRTLKTFIKEIFITEGKPLEKVNYIFCTDSYLIEINKQFLQHDFFTDIISFDLSEGESTIGEVYISIDRVKENSTIHASSYTNELLRVIFHGALHLCGYKDKKKSEITIMRRKEDYYLQMFDQKSKQTCFT